ncbi:hypothetical protein GWK47_041812 [Chionoecetes opilio]|uniref:Endonuclease/exonuclease/phosphatase domain-containing protein n=1 Tax=Chionoecetes opilio TaxID=41210 RepID=A0A8J4YB19_CHIOP|nr:hypothetical protein GWK47_041812 [Chionoecetes opilio]
MTGLVVTWEYAGPTRSLLVAGDFNAHHPILQSVSATNRTGRHLAVLLEEVPHIHLLNTGEPTHVRGGRLDLTLVSGDLAAGASWQVHPTLTSDHYATLTTLIASPPIPPRPLPRWNIKRADWGKFHASLDEWWVTYEPPDDLHQQERDLTAALQRAADAAIPKCSPGRRHRPDWWFYNEDVREHNHRVNLHRKLYKRQPNPTNLRLLQDVVTRARQVSQRAREAKWLEWCASFNQTPPRPAVEECQDGFRCRPAPTGRPPHTHPERRRDSSACLPRVAPAPNFLLAHATSSNSFDNTASRLSGKREGNLTWRTTSSLARNCRRRGKKGATQLQGRTA